MKLRKTQDSLLKLKGLKSEYENYSHFYKAFFFWLRTNIFMRIYVSALHNTFWETYHLSQKL